MITIKDSKYVIFKKKLVDILLTSTMHGVPNITKDSSYLVKIIWFLCLIASMIVCAFFVSASVFSYLNFEVVTQISTIYESESEFPTITICSSRGYLNKTSIFSCEFNTDNCKSNFELFYNEASVLCFKFNSGINITNQSTDILNSTVSGMNFGLILKIHASKSNSFDYTELSLFIHNKSFKPFSLYNKGIRISSGSINTIMLERTFNEKLEYPYNDCYKNIDDFDQNKTIINFMKESNNSYTQTECISYCRNLINIETSGCNCISSIDSFYNCSKSKNATLDCFKSFMKSFQKLNVFEICSKYCPLECDSNTFQLNINTEQLPTSGNINSLDYDLNYFKTYEDIKQKFFKIIVNYAELKYTYINQEPKMLISDLVSNFGGTLGLFLGISFLSFIEIVEIVVEALVTILKVD